MEIQTYSRAGSSETLEGRLQVGTTTVTTISKPGQKHSIYGKQEKINGGLSATAQAMLDNKDHKGRKGLGPNSDLQSYAEKLYKRVS